MSTRGADPTPGSTATIVNPKKATPTEYLILVRIAGAWNEGSKVSASSSAAAIKSSVDSGTTRTDCEAIVAVPARSWQPVKPKTETVTKTTLEAL